MLTEECGLNHHLEKEGIEVVDTDLGERIIQFRNEPLSHIVPPAIHLKKEEVGALFHEKLHTEEGNSDPTYLTAAARIHLREKFLAADVAITGVNFAVAESGTVVVCTNDGNADMGVHAARVQIHCMGIEKIIPRDEDLGVFTRLLARSATGQAVTTYTLHYRKPKPGSQMHIVLVDNGRLKHLGSETHWNGLKCIRCGACINTCPVYRWSGGHSYGSVIPGRSAPSWPHAPERGATKKTWWLSPKYQVSIHASERGATNYFADKNVNFCFNPRTRAGCDSVSVHTPDAMPLFQSTHPSGVRLLRCHVVAASESFQSTHPSGVRQ